MYRNLLLGLAVIIALVVPLSGASTVTLTGGCPLYVINQSRSYITFNVTNSGNGAAADLMLSASFPGISAANSTAVIAEVDPNSSYSRQFHLSSLPGQGSYAVNINATYAQSGSSYATVFPCIIYVGSLAGGPLFAGVSVEGDRMVVNITNTAHQSVEAQVTAVVPSSFTVKDPTKEVTVGPSAQTGVEFDLSSPVYTDATFPVVGELSYMYNGSHYAQMASAPLMFTGVSPTASGGSGLVGLVLAAIVGAIVTLIAVSVVIGRRRGPKQQAGGPESPENKGAEAGK